MAQIAMVMPNSSERAVRPEQAPVADKRKIEAAARQFESILIAKWLEEAQNSFATVPGESEDEDPGADQLRDMSVQFLAEGISSAGGLGIARLLSQQLQEPKAAQSAESKAITASSGAAQDQSGGTTNPKSSANGH